MLKLLCVHVLVLVSFMSYATAATAVQFKDASFKRLTEGSVEISVDGGKVLLERVSSQSFKLNSQLVTFSKNDSFAQMQKKIEKAYTASQKKRASLEDVLMPKAHAVFPLIFSAVVGGMLGMYIGQSSCQESSAAPSSSYEQ